MTLVIAHTGHWLVNILYAAPVLGVMAYIGWNEIQRRREERAAREHSDS